LAPGQPLTIGLLTQGTLYDDVVKEMLDHQGVCYETIEAGSPSLGDYPLVLVSEKSDRALSQEGLCSVSKDDVIAASDVVDLNGILECLSGLGRDKGDRFDLLVNQEELRLSAALKNGMSRKGLPFVVKQLWPGQAKACCVPTHDLDWFSYSPFHKAVFQVKSDLSRKSKILINSALRGRDYGWNIPSILQLERKYGARSTFLFQTDYGEKNSFVEPSLKLLKAEGCEIGLHAAHSSHESEDALRSELKAFNSRTGFSPHGIRYHILKFKVPDSWLMQSSLGLLYDATFSYTDFFGFRGGICFPYHPFADRRLAVTELPTSFMDWTALKRKVRGGRMRNLLGDLMNKTVGYHGVVVVNFHNTYLNKDTFPDVLEAYEWLLSEASKNGYWMATAQQCVEWWNYRASCKPQVQLEEGKTIRAKTQIPLVVEGEDQGFTLSAAG
jgi:peptidoglycan/xylan/chitin deacetylase (PgdA/CDA1 family)